MSTYASKRQDFFEARREAHFSRALELFERLRNEPDSLLDGELHRVAAEVLWQEHKLDSALFHTERALEIFRIQKNEGQWALAFAEKCRILIVLGKIDGNVFRIPEGLSSPGHLGEFLPIGGVFQNDF